MNPLPSSEELLERLRRYYDLHAAEFCADTAELDLRHLYVPFLAHIPAGGHILDAGCGPGRDALAFQRMGYRVTAFDASAQMVELASGRLQAPVQQLTFQELNADAEFDGVWASASLLHVPRVEVLDVLRRLARALKPGGVLYASFKLGAAERWADGRLFNDYDREEFARLVGQLDQLELLHTWITEDVRPARKDEQWLNALLRRRLET